MRRRLIVTGAILVVIVGALSTACGFLVIRPLPTVDADLRLLGLNGRVEVLRDKYGVPHIFAGDEHDLFFVQGYVTAQDRLFQMDLYRRAAQGRLAEVLGEPGLESDRFMRTIGLGRAAQLDLAMISPEALDALEAYMEGVNKFLQQHGESLPVEFTILGYRPDPWTPVDTLSIAKLQLYDAAGNYTQELLRANIAARLGPDVLGTLLPDPTLISTADDARAWALIAPYMSPGRTLDGAAALAGILGGAGQGLGSNCWALAGSRTASGRPLLAGDPHLPVRNPSIWYEVALDAGDLHLIGFSIPGVPGVVIGHNDRVAWSFTYAYADTQDLFVERQDPTDLRRYEFEGRMENATVTREVIRVKGRADPVVVVVVTTRHGPILTSVLKEQKAQLALRWSALDGTRTVEAVFGMNRARNFSEFRAAAALFVGASLSACYADVDGHIGYLLVGRLPDRKSGDGRMPVPGWDGAHEWRGLRPAEDNPFLFDPPGGVVLNANNRPVDRATETGWEGEWDPGFRFAYLRQALGDIRGADVARLRSLQTDVTSLPVQRFRAAILSARAASPLAAEGQRLVREWDGTLGVDSAAAAVYESWLVRMVERTFRDKLGPTLYDQYVTDGRPTFALHELVASPSSTWFADLAGGENGDRDTLSSHALEDAVRDLERRLGSNVSSWRWGDLHTISFEHPLSAAKPLDRLFTVGPFPRPGDGYSPNNGAYSLLRPFALRSHASHRQIVDFADIDASISIIPTGQSGHPFSGHWRDQTELWARGDYKPMALSRERIGELEGKLILRGR
ncbi:MAG TPA: penicillin acylase family protein [Candidatus Limnocylindria bacterium]|nr:penicillin acylase family protein [Candidatus Limnocylindria bacterium]